MEELIKIDSNFSEAKFKTNVDNIFIKLHMAVMLKDLDRVKHFISDSLYEKYTKIIEELKTKNLIEMYDELNVASTEITKVDIREDKYVIEVQIKSKCMNYYIDSDTKRFVSGNNTRREEKMSYLRFEKVRDYINQSSARKCPSCGANIDVNNNGKCKYCGTTYNLKDYDWILVNIE